MRGNGYDGVRTELGVASKGALTVLAESVDIVATALDTDSTEVLEGKSDAWLGGFANVGVVLSDGLFGGDCFDAISCCFFAMTSLMRFLMFSIPLASCAITVVTCGCTPMGRDAIAGSVGRRGTVGFAFSSRVAIAVGAVGDIGDPCSKVPLDERCFCVSVGLVDFVGFIIVADSR